MIQAEIPQTENPTATTPVEDVEYIPLPKLQKFDTTSRADYTNTINDKYQQEIYALGEEGHYGPMTDLKSVSTFKAKPIDDAPPDMKAIMKEITKDLPDNIEISSRASMFVRYDEDHPQYIRALLTGIEGTPYESGLFLFDIHCGNNYPNSHCDVKHITVGESEVYGNHTPGGFSPNLHRGTGKVCLSLLGTWEGPGWEPNQSNVYQVLSSIMWMIFGAEYPYYMEPSYGGWEGHAPTSGHAIDVISYSEQIQYATLKYAIIAQLVNPPTGFEKVVRRHFVLKHELIIATTQSWIKKTKSEDLKQKLTKLLQVFTDIIKIVQKYERYESLKNKVQKRLDYLADKFKVSTNNLTANNFNVDHPKAFKNISEGLKHIETCNEKFTTYLQEMKTAMANAQISPPQYVSHDDYNEDENYDENL